MAIAAIAVNLLVGFVAVVADDGASSAVATNAPTTDDAAASGGSTTAAAAPSATAPLPPGLDASHARISVRNEYSRTVTVSVGDATDGSWVLQPGETTATWDLATSPDHGAGVSIVDSAGCGSSDGTDSFIGGHVYELVAVSRADDCPTGSPGPLLLIKDLTTGGTATV